MCPLFRSFLQAGFECSTHKNTSGRRLDLLCATGHDRFIAQDYQLIQKFGITTVRTAARWHLIEGMPGQFDFRSLEHILDEADRAEMEVVLDILHFGCPDHIDFFSPKFPGQFARFTRELIRFLKRRGNYCRLFAPVNEISYLSWAGGDKAAISPFAVNRGHELKRNLVRAAIASSDVLLNEVPGVRLIAPEPAIHIVGNPDIPGDEEEAAHYTLSYFESWDMLSGRLAPELGGGPEYLDVLGVNYYARNEWVHNSGPLSRSDPRWRPFSQILQDVWDRYQRPLFVSETGTEDDSRDDWFNYVCGEVASALSRQVPVHGICLYPILNHPGWDDDRHCHNGLFDYADELGNRQIHEPLARALMAQCKRFSSNSRGTHEHENNRSDLLFTSQMGIRLPAAATLNEQVRP